jgi:hypothetical protein
MSGVLADSRNGISTSASLVPAARRRSEEEKPRTPSGGTVPIQQPPGIDIIDRMCLEQDRADRAAAVRVRIETEMVEAAMNDKTSRKANTAYDPLRRYDSEVPPVHREKK